MKNDHLVHLLKRYLTHPNEVIDVDLVDTLFYLEREGWSCGYMMLAIHAHAYECGLYGHTLRWEFITRNLLDMGCLQAVAALSRSVKNDFIKERIIGLTLKHKGVTTPSSLPPTLHTAH